MNSWFKAKIDTSLGSEFIKITHSTLLQIATLSASTAIDLSFSTNSGSPTLASNLIGPHVETTWFFIGISLGWNGEQQKFNAVILTKGTTTQSKVLTSI